MLENIILQIKPLDANAMEKCQLRLDNLTKPHGSLHAFEHLACQMAGITGDARPRNMPKSIVLMTEDNRKAAEEMITLPVFANHVAANLVMVDVNTLVGKTEGDIQGKMSREQAILLIKAGINIARREISTGTRIIGLGTDVTNTVCSSAIIDCYNSQNDPIGKLCEIEGFHVAVLVGVILGAALGRAAVVLDDFTTSAAALIAVRIAPGVRGFLVGSHFSPEPAHKHVLDLIAVPAYLHLDISTGQGIGAALGISLIEAALHVLNDMKTFGEAQVAVAQDGPGALKQSQY